MILSASMTAVIATWKKLFAIAIVIAP